MTGSTAGGPPWRVLLGAAVVLYLLVPVRWAHDRWSDAHRRIDRTEEMTAAVVRRAVVAEAVDRSALKAELTAVDEAMPVGAIDTWIDAVSALARSTGTVWRSATVTAASTAPPGEPSSTTVAAVVDGPVRGLLSFVDQLRTGTVRLTLVDEFALGAPGGDAGRTTLSVKVRVLSFLPLAPSPVEG